MEVRIGIQSVPRELIVETDTSASDIEDALAEALGDAKSGVFSVEVSNGGKVLIPADKVAYVEFTGAEPRRVGFGGKP